MASGQWLRTSGHWPSFGQRQDADGDLFDLSERNQLAGKFVRLITCSPVIRTVDEVFDPPVCAPVEAEAEADVLDSCSPSIGADEFGFSHRRSLSISGSGSLTG